MRTDEPERRFAPGSVLRISGKNNELVVSHTRWHSGRFLVKFVDYEDRSAVDALRGAELVVAVSDDELPSGEDEFYDRQLIGLRVRNAAGIDIGIVTSVDHFPAQDLLSVRTESGDFLVPFVNALVPEVDLSAGYLQLADVRGLVEEE